MGDRPLDWRSFWDVATPRHAAQMLLAHYGASARQAAAQCAQAALEDERWEDHGFWKAALDELQGKLMEPAEHGAVLADAGDSGFF